jgi:hypothetical protein
VDVMVGLIRFMGFIRLMIYGDAMADAVSYSHLTGTKV